MVSMLFKPTPAPCLGCAGWSRQADGKGTVNSDSFIGVWPQAVSLHRQSHLASGLYTVHWSVGRNGTQNEPSSYNGQVLSTTFHVILALFAESWNGTCMCTQILCVLPSILPSSLSSVLLSSFPSFLRCAAKRLHSFSCLLIFSNANPQLCTFLVLLSVLKSTKWKNFGTRIHGKPASKGDGSCFHLQLTPRPQFSVWLATDLLCMVGKTVENLSWWIHQWKPHPDLKPAIRAKDLNTAKVLVLHIGSHRMPFTYPIHQSKGTQWTSECQSLQSHNYIRLATLKHVCIGTNNKSRAYKS